MAITKQQMLDKLAEHKTTAQSALDTLVANNDSIDDTAVETKLNRYLMILAVAEPLIKKYVEDNY